MHNFEDYQQAFRAFSNPARAAGMKAYMKNHFDFLGVKTPERRDAFKPYLAELKADLKAGQGLDTDFVNRSWALPEREFHYNACDYLRLPAVKKTLEPDALPWLRLLVETNTWWDSVDRLDTVIGDIVLRNPELDVLMLEWARDDNFWVRRVAINHQRSRKKETNTALLEQILVLNFGSKEFFINKAIGWALREYAKTDAGWVRDFVGRYEAQLASLSVREAMKHLR